MSELFAYSHPGFIWTSYAITALGVGGLIYWILSERAAVKKRLDREEKRKIG